MSDLDTLAGSGTPSVRPNGGEKPKHPSLPPEVMVIPYNAATDPDADKLLPYLWGKLKEDGLLGLYFPRAPETCFAGFVKMFSSLDQHVLLVVLKNEQGEPDKAMGFVSWGSTVFGNAKAALSGFIFLKEFWNHHTSEAAAHEIMRYWFEESKLDVVIGNVAQSNKLARQFLLRLGWKHGGDIPMLQTWNGRQDTASLWYVTREEWEG